MLKQILKATIVLVAVVAIAGLQSCKKEETPVPQYTILKPKPYLPAYPGSWWKYVQKNGDSLSWTTSSHYLSHHYTQADFTTSPSVAVPYLNGEPLYEYDRIVNPPGVLYSQRWPILSETIGFQFERDKYDVTVADSLRDKVSVLGKIPNLLLNGVTYDTVLVQKSFSWSLNGQQTIAPVSTSEYFAKNIGLVFKVKVDTTSNDTFYSQKIVSYHIHQ